MINHLTTGTKETDVCPCVLSVYLSSKRSAYITVCVFKNCLMLAGVISPLLLVCSYTELRRTHTHRENSHRATWEWTRSCCYTHTHKLKRSRGKKTQESTHYEFFFFLPYINSTQSIIRFANLQLNLCFIILILQLWIITLFIFTTPYYKLCICSLHTVMLHPGNTFYNATENAYTIQLFWLEQLMKYGVCFEGWSQAQFCLPWPLLTISAHKS